MKIENKIILVGTALIIITLLFNTNMYLESLERKKCLNSFSCEQINEMVETKNSVGCASKYETQTIHFHLYFYTKCENSRWRRDKTPPIT